MQKMSPVVHFEMPAKDKKRVKKFYESTFGWKVDDLGPKMGNYLMAVTSPMTKDNMHKKKGVINGGFFEMGTEGSVPHIVIQVKNLEKSIERIKKSGGKVEGGPQDIPGVGKFVMFQDTERNRVGMLQPSWT